MTNYFYSHLVEIDSITLALDGLDITADEKKKLEKLAHNQLHHAIVGLILSELTERDKKIFLANLRYETSDKIWKHLNEKIDKIEDKVKKEATRLKEELHNDILDIKKNGPL